MSEKKKKSSTHEVIQRQIGEAPYKVETIKPNYLKPRTSTKQPDKKNDS